MHNLLYYYSFVSTSPLPSPILRIPSLIPRPSTPPVFDCLQYAKTGGVEGLGMRLGILSIGLGKGEVETKL